jgi:hypothetical protein
MRTPTRAAASVRDERSSSASTDKSGQEFNMNRKDRRKAAAQGQPNTMDAIVAVHEAGHVVARVLTARVMGYEPPEAIRYVRVETAPRHIGSSLDGTMSLKAQAITFGPMLSKPIQNALSQHLKGRGEIMPSDLVPLIRNAREAGVDVGAWLQSRIIIAALGPAAEAKFRGSAFDEVWNSYESEADFKSAVQDGVLAGLPNEEIYQVIGQGAAIACRLVEDETVWRAILAVSQILKTGRTPGRRVAGVAIEALGAERLERGVHE